MIQASVFAGSANFERDIGIVEKLLNGVSKRDVATELGLNKERIDKICKKMCQEMLNRCAKHGENDTLPDIGTIEDMRKHVDFWQQQIATLKSEYHSL